jgi:hypothetical protein
MCNVMYSVLRGGGRGEGRRCRRHCLEKQLVIGARLRRTHKRSGELVSDGGATISWPLYGVLRLQLEYESLSLVPV